MLGDDVVIADGKVASEYRSILDDLGVTISSQKSIVSKIGSFEFAKRFRGRTARYFSCFSENSSP